MAERGDNADVERSSIVPGAADAVWQRAVTPEGINSELSPWLRMTMPKALRGRTIDDVAPGQPLGRSWLLLFGVLPIDYDDLNLVELEPGRRFLERSKMLSMRVWQHERVVEKVDRGSCRVSDRLSFELRPPISVLPGGHTLARAMVGAIFGHRHRRMIAHFSRSA